MGLPMSHASHRWLRRDRQPHSSPILRGERGRLAPARLRSASRTGDVAHARREERPQLSPLSASPRLLVLGVCGPTRRRLSRPIGVERPVTLMFLGGRYGVEVRAGGDKRARDSGRGRPQVSVSVERWLEPGLARPARREADRLRLSLRVGEPARAPARPARDLPQVLEPRGDASAVRRGHARRAGCAASPRPPHRGRGRARRRRAPC